MPVVLFVVYDTVYGFKQAKSNNSSYGFARDVPSTNQKQGLSVKSNKGICNMNGENPPS